MNQRLDIQYYEILGVSPSASLEEIELAYKKACEIYSENNPEFANSFNQEEALELRGWVDEAYQILIGKLKSQTQFLEAQLSQSKNERSYFQFETEEEPTSFSTDEEKNIDTEEVNFESLNFYDGLNLKKLRLKNNISLNYISNKTCIGIHHLIAIEANDFASLPAGVFVRSYVKQIAQILGLDAKDVCQSYMKLYNEARGEI